jgi:hypothetical protein
MLKKPSWGMAVRSKVMKVLFLMARQDPKMPKKVKINARSVKKMVKVKLLSCSFHE